MTGDIVLDTSAVVAHLRGVATVTAKLQAALQGQGTLHLPLTAWGELLYGVEHAGQPAREVAKLAEFARITSRLLPTDRTAEHYAKVKEALAVAGALIPENDIWIAACALEHGLPLATRDAHFARVPGLTVLDWQ